MGWLAGPSDRLAFPSPVAGLPGAGGVSHPKAIGPEERNRAREYASRNLVAGTEIRPMPGRDRYFA